MIRCWMRSGQNRKDTETVYGIEKRKKKAQAGTKTEQKRRKV